MNKILLIDDEYLVLESLERRINWNNCGWQVVAKAINGAAGLEFIKQFQPDLVMTDIRMPVMNGLELIKQSSKLFPEVKYVVLTGHSEFEYAKEAIKYGVLDFCVKPFDEEEIYEILHKAKKAIDMQKFAKEKINEINIKESNTIANEQKHYKNATMQRILAYINEHYSDTTLSVSKISSVFGFNSNYTSQFFKKSSEQNFSSYLTSVRIDRAKELLTNTDMQIAEISSKVGYTDYFYFSKVFKKVVNATPGEFRSGIKND